ncbi:MAG: tRNA (adenosine(37)-N6)-threonylcarbamoyltransferase complex transferase subunit TsaD [Candidatus Omnitrophica bacterium]|nr:tRNA (adenosine(37)-N6)-threonylcarbamoyltransferase complex transferase subunit TsaD [Candidatus Omnitrophota bacterium]
MITLGIETSCDETAAAVVDRGKVLSGVVSSSVPLHRKYGGVVPEIASRFHIEYINRVTKKALINAKKTIVNVELVAVTELPGLPGSLLSGLSFAKALSYSLNIPLIGINHLHAHIYANFLGKKRFSPRFPFIGVVVSGGHTNIFICRSIKEFSVVGSTKDDAVGEAFDKVAKILGIGYPGGPLIEKYAKRFLRFGMARDNNSIDFPRVFLDRNSLDFSLSGVKTAVLYYAREKKLSRREIARISWSFQEAVFDVLTGKIITACKRFGIKEIFLGGGVISNKCLRGKIKAACKRLGYKFFFPPAGLCVDNAAMVAGLGEALYKYA